MGGPIIAGQSDVRKPSPQQSVDICAFIQLLAELSAGHSLPSAAVSGLHVRALDTPRTPLRVAAVGVRTAGKWKLAFYSLTGDMAALPPGAKITATCSPEAGRVFPP